MIIKNKHFSVLCSDNSLGVKIVSVSMRFDNGIRGCAEANYMPDFNYWWICRVVLYPADCRGRGFGSKMLKLMLDNIFDTDAEHKVVVAPGGYDAEPKKQKAFYLKHGFEKDPHEDFLFLTKEKWEKIHGRIK